MPPKNKPTAAEIRACLPYLATEVRLLQPTLRVVVALGRIAWEGVLRVYREHLGYTHLPRLPFAHAAVYRPDPALPTFIASYHPSRQNTQTGRLTPAMFDRVWQLARKALEAGA